MSQWTLWLRDVAANEPAAMISVLATEGVVPCAAGARMLATADALQGTLGGGAFEALAVERARALLAGSPGTWVVEDIFPEQGCPGRVRFLFEHVDPAALGWLREVVDATPRSALVTTLGVGRIDRRVATDTMPVRLSARGALPEPGFELIERITLRRRPLYLFGAGNVGRAVARHAEGLPFSLAWFDTREELAWIDGLAVVALEDVADCVAAAPADAAIAIITHDGAIDYLLAHAALTREAPVAFVGMLGSQSKRTKFFLQLERDGVPSEAFARLHCPIGLPGVHGREPDIIAISVLAQLLALPAA